MKIRKVVGPILTPEGKAALRRIGRRMKDNRADIAYVISVIGSIAVVMYILCRIAYMQRGCFVIGGEWAIPVAALIAWAVKRSADKE